MFAFWQQFSLVGKAAAIVGAVAVAITSTVAAWPIVEPYAVAHRGYVVYYVAERSSSQDAKITRSLQIAVDSRIEQKDTALQANISELKKWEIELAKPQEPVAAQLMTIRVEELKNKISEIKSEIDSLKKERAAGP